ncbi:DUF488 domain-containing protein [Sphingobacterium sp. WM]|uniref:DUF488 domain-containing protein n=1 Tax=Sphingobacterium sp. WM TaxID=3031802 RepID=UPI00240CFFBA|nr:DUF488 domain-containing protein [Sphingobacterium sp. WM]WFB62441.1 DUF488 domain-containing protein [Sphingobacterium sp. WM]
MEQNRIIYSIGHSTHPIQEFLDMLNSFDIKLLVDIRRHPGSRKYPQFNQDELRSYLENNGIAYQYLEALGGRRPTHKDSHNSAWKNESFRGYADYMETDGFVQGIQELENLATERKTAFMCSEAVWWRCHRSLVSDYLKFKGWKVWHIMGIGKAQEHPYTSVAKITDSGLTYSGN